jgi:arsenical-resistance protein 2
MNVMVLEGGVKGWVKAGPQFTQLMDGYREDYWQELFAEEEAKKDGTSSAAAGQGDVGK